MKKILFFLLLLPIFLTAQVGMFGTQYAHVDTTHLIADGAADSSLSLVMEYSNQGVTNEGRVGIYFGVYSPGGLSATVYLYGREWCGVSSAGGNLYGQWTLLDSITSAQASDNNYGNDMTGKNVDPSDSKTNWQVHNGFQVYPKFTPGAADTAIVILRFKEGKREL